MEEHYRILTKEKGAEIEVNYNPSRLDLILNSLSDKFLKTFCYSRTREVKVLITRDGDGYKYDTKYEGDSGPRINIVTIFELEKIARGIFDDRPEISQFEATTSVSDYLFDPFGIKRRKYNSNSN